MRHLRHRRTPFGISFQLVTHGMTLALAVALAGGCASSSGASKGGSSVPASPAARAGASSANLAGARCHGATCSCRDPRGPAVENPPPDEGHKRFEVRLAALEGSASLSSPTLGSLSSSGDEACYYIDVVPGTTHDVTFVAREGRSEAALAR